MVRERVRRQASCALVAAAAAAVASCDRLSPEHRAVEDDATAVEERIRESREESGKPRPRTIRVVTDRPYVGLQEILLPPPPRRGTRSRLPARLLAPDAVTISLAGAATPAAIAARIESASGIPVRLDGAEPLRAEDGAGAAITVFGTGLGDNRAPEADIWTSALDDLLDAWTEAQGWEWTYDAAAGAIRVARFRSVVFLVHALAGTQAHQASASTRSSTGEQSGQALAEQTISLVNDYDIWTTIERQVAALISPPTRVQTSPETAAITVSGLPADVTRVRNYLAFMNREVLRPVTVTVHMYSVARERDAASRLDIVADLRRVFGTRIDLSLESLVEDAGAPISIVRPTDAAAGSSLTTTVTALRELGTVNRVLSGSVPSLNGQVAQFSELLSQAYVSRVATTVDDGVVQTEIETDDLSSGVSISYVARVTAPDEVLLRLFALVQEKPVLTLFTAGASAVQLPTYTSRSLAVAQQVRRGETLLVTSYADRAGDRNTSGTFDPEIPLPAGAADAGLSRQDLVLLLTADIGEPLGVGEAPGATL